MSWKNVWIIGASTGIGRELALQLADSSENIICSARSKEKLDELAQSSDTIHSFPLDVTDQEATLAATQDIEDLYGPIDLIIYNPGIWKPYKDITEFNWQDCKTSMDINYMGAIYVLDKIIPKMMARKAGHIALVGSIAGYRGLKKIGAYGPTKAALINLAETLKLDLEKHGITVSIINPAFVDTPMTAVNDFKMPFIITAQDAASRIIKGLKKKRYEIAFPFPMIRFWKRLRSMPHGLFFMISRKML